METEDLIVEPRTRQKSKFGNAEWKGTLADYTFFTLLKDEFNEDELYDPAIIAKGSAELERVHRLIEKHRLRERFGGSFAAWELRVRWVQSRQTHILEPSIVTSILSAKVGAWHAGFPTLFSNTHVLFISDVAAGEALVNAIKEETRLHKAMRDALPEKEKRNTPARLPSWSFERQTMWLAEWFIARRREHHPETYQA